LSDGGQKPVEFFQMDKNQLQKLGWVDKKHLSGKPLIQSFMHKNNTRLTILDPDSDWYCYELAQGKLMEIFRNHSPGLTHALKREDSVLVFGLFKMSILSQKETVRNCKPSIKWSFKLFDLNSDETQQELLLKSY